MFTSSVQWPVISNAGPRTRQFIVFLLSIALHFFPFCSCISSDGFFSFTRLLMSCNLPCIMPRRCFMALYLYVMWCCTICSGDASQSQLISSTNLYSMFCIMSSRACLSPLSTNIARWVVGSRITEFNILINTLGYSWKGSISFCLDTWEEQNSGKKEINKENIVMIKNILNVQRNNNALTIDLKELSSI